MFKYSLERVGLQGKHEPHDEVRETNTEDCSIPFIHGAFKSFLGISALKMVRLECFQV